MLVIVVVPAVKLNGPLVLDGDVLFFNVTSDSTHVVYVADQDVDGVRELYSVPIGGGSPIKLNGPLAGQVKNHVISADGATVSVEGPSGKKDLEASVVLVAIGFRPNSAM